MTFFKAFPALLLLLFLPTLLSATNTTLCPTASTCLTRLQSNQPCDVLPTPPQAIVSSIRPVGFNLTRVRPGVFHYNDGAAHVLLLYSTITRHLVVIDFPRSATALRPDGTYLPFSATLELLSSAIPVTITMVYSHRHLDHVGNARVYYTQARSQFPAANFQVISSPEIFFFLRDNPAIDIPRPDVIVEQARELKIPVGPELLLSLRVFGGHTNADLLAHVLPTTTAGGVVHYVDILTRGNVPFLSFGLSVDLGRYIRAQEELLGIPFEVLSPGHGNVAGKNDVMINLEYTRSVLQAAIRSQDMIDGEEIGRLSGRVADPTDPAFGSSSLVFSRIIEMRTEFCFREIIRKWGCRLGSVDIFGRSHCLAAGIFSILDLP